MKEIILSLFIAAASVVSAAEYTLDFRGAAELCAEPPVLRRVAMPMSVGTVPGVAVGDIVRLVLFEDVSFSLKVVFAPPAGIAGPSFIARDLNSEASAIVKPTADGLRITVDDFNQNKIYSFRIKDGVTTCVVREKSTEPGECATCAATRDGVDVPSGDSQEDASSVRSRAVRTKAVVRGVGDDFSLADHNPIIDVLVAFDRGAKAWAESDSWPDGDTIEEFADYAVNKMNDVLEHSQLLDKFSYRLVGVVEVDATYDAINQNLLGSLRLRNSGALACVGEVRERCGADTITLLVDRTQGTTAGLGYEYLTQWTAQSFDSNGYTCNICDIKTVHSRYTMSHEQGHNLGCGHSNQQGKDSGPGRYSYSCGYHFQDADGTNRYTVMAYSYTSPASGEYYPVPYFSTPEISPPDLGVPVGTSHSNDNRRTILQTYRDASAWREHVVPYDWDVRFLDGNGNDIPDGAYFSPSLYVTFSHENPNAVIYYTYDGSTPSSSSAYCTPGTRFTFTGTRTITACAVIDGVAQSVRTITFNEGLSWSGETGEDGNGVWKDGDSSVLSWNNSTSYFYSYMDAVMFPDLAENAAPTVTVHGTVVPKSAAFAAAKTAYTFEKGTADALIHLRDASFAPSGDLTFNVPVQLDSVAFTNPASHTLTFNAPFGQTIAETTGYCTNAIGIGAYGTLTISPGAGNTQTFDHFSNGSWFYNNARINVSSGTVVFKGPASNKGLFGSTQFNVARDANVVLDMTSSSYDPFYSSVVSGNGTITYKAMLPSNPSRWTSADWKGTIVFEGLAANDSTKDFQFEDYGNASSKILLRNCSISYLSKSNSVFPGTLVLDGEGALQINNGYSGWYCTFGALEGSGSMSFTGSSTHGYVFNTATNYTGSITIAMSGNTGRCVVFGTTASASDLPSQSASITVKSGATASIGGGATWYAYHGVEVGGTLLVKGANATLDCHSSAAMGLKLDDGATLRFDTADAKLTFAKAPQFAAGTVNIAFAAGVAPQGGERLVMWPTNAAPEGTFAFADATLAAAWDLCEAATGLFVKPKNRFDIPGSEGVYIVETASLAVWLEDNNFELYEFFGGTWQEFLQETGANGYVNWMNYVLGLSASDPVAKVKAKISFDAQGRVTVSVADSIPRAPTVPGLKVVCTLLESGDMKDWRGAESPVDGKVVTVEKSGDGRFYKVEVSVAAE